jgi:membrane protease YdiL (CAAX protease family)
MHARYLVNRTGSGRLLSLLLVLSLVFAALHVSQHDLVEGSGGSASHSECQLSHVPGAQLCSPLVPVLLLVLAFVLVLSATAIYTQSSVRLQCIRAPPPPS